jgi:hypothetical protein
MRMLNSIKSGLKNAFIVDDLIDRLSFDRLLNELGRFGRCIRWRGRWFGG